MITVHRHDVMENKATIIFNKIKPRSVGSIGEIELFFDLNSLTYYELDAVNPSNLQKRYASPKGQTISSKLVPELNVIIPPKTLFKDDLPF